MNNLPPISQQELEMIDSYLSGQLSADEKKIFEQRLQTDANWAAQVNEIKLLSVGIQESALRNTLRDLGNTVAEKNAPVPVRKMSWLKKLSVAAMLVVIVSTLSWLLFLKPSQNEKLFADFYKPDAGLPTEMGVSDNYQFERAMVDYKRGKYKEAVTEWNKLATQEPANDTLQYFIGCAELAEKNLQPALNAFDIVLQNKNSFFQKDACWYKGLLLLQQNKKPEAIGYIEKSDHPQKAALLQKLKQ